ncbi:hypothetical protein [Prauserella halophila]|uniref:hypothetical protein n=1 Tax=Prauserella halophila TaxID=185641 RepID=UPI0031D61D55
MLLRAHKKNRRAELAEVGMELDEDMFVFMGAPMRSRRIRRTRSPVGTSEWRHD